jgi:hypothetical protein
LVDVIFGLCCDYYRLFYDLHFEYLSVSGISRFIEIVDLSFLTDSIWNGLSVRLKYVCYCPVTTSSKVDCHIDSAIISGFPGTFWKVSLWDFDFCIEEVKTLSLVLPFMRNVTVVPQQ